MAPAFRHLPLGERIPSSPHAVSCSLPTMRDVRGYEERDPDVLRHVTSGYPRFVVHRFARELGAHLAADDSALRGRTVWLTSSASMARRLSTYLAPEAEAQVFERDGVFGVSHVDAPAIFSQAKSYLQHVGGFISSRAAEDQLIRLGLRSGVSPEAVFDGDAEGEIKRRLSQVLPGTTAADLFVAASGMNAMDATFRAVSDIQASRGRTVWLQVGWLYLDTIAILQKFTASPGDYVYVRDVFDTSELGRIIAHHAPRLAGVIAEVPTNPLVQTPDLPALSALCRHHGARLLVDPSIVSVYNVNVLPHADVGVSSLTKYTASEGVLTAGLVAVNPACPDAAAIRVRVAANLEPFYQRDAARLAHQIGETPDVLARIHASTPRVVAFLEQHPAVKDVFWAMHPASRDNYARLAHAPGSTGGMVTFTLREPGALTRVYDRLRLPKGPSFGMTTTLVCPFMYLAHYDLVASDEGRARLAADGLDPDLLRLCVGAEPVEEIIAALAEALE